MTLNIRELEELLKEESQKLRHNKHFRENTDVIEYIRSTGIESGEYKVPTYVIYFHFIKWAEDKWVKKWGRTEFFRTFNRYLTLKRSGKQRYYMLNLPLITDQVTILEAKNYGKKTQKQK